VNAPTNIIVPVYRGIALTKRCLETLAASCLPANCRITLINDASPEAGMAEMLAEFVGTRASPPHRDGYDCGVPLWELLRNASNLGFVASVNRGMARHPAHDVVLLNSDTEVPPGWLQRLRSAAYRRDEVGTVTPFSNCGSLASYPLPNVENALPQDLTLEQLDLLFQAANAGRSVDIPTGVGFCLFIRRDCLDDTGGFDEATFGKGYGEENDFCLRASKRGWTHVLAADCFVYHKGRGSFGGEKDELVKHAYAALVALHPHYPSLIQRHFVDDPVRPFRLRADFLRLARHQRGISLISGVAHGNTSTQLDEIAGPVAVLNLSAGRHGLFELRWQNAGEAFKLWFRLPEDSHDLCELLLSLPVTISRGTPYPAMHQAMSKLVSDATRKHADAGKIIVPQELLEVVARHAFPRFTAWQALARSLPRLLATQGLRLSESHLLRPLAALVPLTVRIRIRHWIKATRA
jgi:GT2 family glycosyltransferase